MPSSPNSDLIVWSPGPSSSSQPSQERPKGLYETQDGLQLDTNVCFDPDDEGNTLWYQFSTRWDKRGQSVGEFVSTMYGSAETGQWGLGDKHYDSEDAKEAAEHHRRRVARAVAARTADQDKNAPSVDDGVTLSGVRGLRPSGGLSLDRAMPQAQSPMRVRNPDAYCHSTPKDIPKPAYTLVWQYHIFNSSDQAMVSYASENTAWSVNSTHTTQPEMSSAASSFGPSTTRAHTYDTPAATQSSLNPLARVLQLEDGTTDSSIPGGQPDLGHTEATHRIQFPQDPDGERGGDKQGADASYRG